MKKYVYLIPFFLMFLSAFSQPETVLKDFYFEKTRNNWKEHPADWQIDGDFAIKRLGYWRGSTCGSVPTTERVVGHIVNDTVFINYNIKIDPFCDSSIGLAANAIDLVINTQKYPNYQNFTFKIGLNSLSYEETVMLADYEFSYDRGKLTELEMIYEIRSKL